MTTVDIPGSPSRHRSQSSSVPSSQNTTVKGNYIEIGTSRPLSSPISPIPVKPLFVANGSHKVHIGQDGGTCLPVETESNDISLDKGIPLQTAAADMMSGALPVIRGDGFDYEQQDQLSGENIERPATAASGDTYHQAQTLFHDFDGTHYASSIREPRGESENVDRSSVIPNFLLPRPKFPPPAPGMVYYPAPVPSNLKLPPRLSKAPPAHLEAKRRSELLSTIAPDARKSAPWLKHNRTASAGDIIAGRQSVDQTPEIVLKVPPQLRATAFFDRSGTSQEVEIKDKSAVNTLEDLLNASATAPVSAFTDHMFAGGVGSKIYKRELVTKPEANKSTPDLIGEKRRSSFLGLRRSTMTSESVLVGEAKPKSKFRRTFSLGTKLDDSTLNRDENGDIVGTRTNTPMPGAEDDEGSQSGVEDFDMPSDEDEFYNNGPPTTLLAELQIRKEAQKQRKKTALSSFPNGMHSTLLELDAVAQIQKQKRKTTRVQLAWENDRDNATPEVNDEDVPLAVLFAGTGKVKDQMKEQGTDWDRPLGLIELREREDNEPLSLRRARLKGINPYQMQEPAPVIYVDEDVESEQGNPEETLAQRRERLAKKEAQDSQDLTELDGHNVLQRSKSSEDSLKGGPASRPISKAFTDELLEELELEPGVRKAPEFGELKPPADDGPQAARNDSPVEEEETLGQRRARLQRLSQAQGLARPTMDQRHSSLPQARPQALRTSTSMADLLQFVPPGTTRKVSDQQLVDSLPQDSLLKQSENVRMARQQQIRGGGMARSSSGLTGTLYTNAADADHHRNSSFKSGFYNNGQGLSTTMLADNTRQSMYGLGQQPGMAGMQIPLYTPDPMLQQAQLLNYQNAQMASMMSMTMGMPFGQPPIAAGGFAPPPAASTSNFMANGHPNHPMQAMPMMGGVHQHAQMMHEAFLDDRGRERIDAWRQSVQMD